MLVMFFVLLCATLGFGQKTFRESAVGIGKIDEAIAQCGAVPNEFPVNFYNPPQDSYKKAKSFFTVDKNHWACMWTGTRYQWKAEPAGAKYGRVAGGDFSFEGHASKGINACHNRTLAVFYAEEIVTITTPTPTPTPVAPVPTPTPIVITEPCKPGETKTEPVIENGVQVGTRVYNNCTSVTKLTYEKTVTVDSCPSVTDAQYGSKGFWNRMPNWQELLAGPGKAMLLAGILNKEDRGKAIAVSGISSGIDTTVMSIFIPDLNVLQLTTSAGPMLVQKGKAPFEINTREFGLLRLEWKKDGNIQLTSPRTVCFAGAVQKGFQTGSDVIVYRDGKGTTGRIPVKSQEQTPVGYGGLNNGGCIPGANPGCVITSSIPTRPTASNPYPTVSNVPILTQPSIPVRRAFAEEGNLLTQPTTQLPSNQVLAPTTNATPQSNCGTGSVPYTLSNGQTICAKVQ